MSRDNQKSFSKNVSVDTDVDTISQHQGEKDAFVRIRVNNATKKRLKDAARAEKKSLSQFLIDSSTYVITNNIVVDTSNLSGYQQSINKDTDIGFRINEGVKAALNRFAARANKSLSEFVITNALYVITGVDTEKSTVNTDVDTGETITQGLRIILSMFNSFMSEDRAFSARVREYFTDDSGEQSEEYRVLMAAIKELEKVKGDN